MVDMPQMLRAIIRQSLARDPRFVMVGEYPKDVAIEVAVDRAKADYVIVGADVFEPGSISRRMLAQGPQVRVLAVRPDGAQTTLYELRPEEIELGELSPTRLLTVMSG